MVIGLPLEFGSEHIQFRQSETVVQHRPRGGQWCIAFSPFLLHLFPQELESVFKKVFGDDYNQDDFMVAIVIDIHKEIHGNVPKEMRGEFRGIFADPETAQIEYNQRWRDFFAEFKDGASPTPQQVIKFTEDLVDEFGLNL